MTHGYYRYPAATSPELVRELIAKLSEPGDIVLDPFMGGGTTIVEAIASGRRAVGLDINELALFVSTVKTRPLYPGDWKAIDAWLAEKPLLAAPYTEMPFDARYRNLPSELLLPAASGLRAIGELPKNEQRTFLRCALLRTMQWALEAKDASPNPEELTRKLETTVRLFRNGMDELVGAATKSGLRKSSILGQRVLVGGAAQDIFFMPQVRDMKQRINLVVTSPPYPGVHILYHRWQVKSRRETPAPYWIANRQAGAGETFYTMGGRSEVGLNRYFQDIRNAFAAIRPLLAPDSLVAQIVAFSDAEAHLPLFQASMRQAGYREADPFGSAQELTRDVPNRRWYARGKENDAAREFVLFFQPATS